MVLVDSHVLSELTKPTPDEKVVLWLRPYEPHLVVKDSLIAATALAHGFEVATHNTADFKNAGVSVANPFST